MPEMVVPKSSHDRSCSKKSSPNARSTITIYESAIPLVCLLIESRVWMVSSDRKGQWQHFRSSGFPNLPIIDYSRSRVINSLGVSGTSPRRKASRNADSEIVMVDLAFGDDFFKQNRSWDDVGTTISGI